MNVGVCFGDYCPLHQGLMDIIMRAKKENDVCFVVVCGFDNEAKSKKFGLSLNRRVSLIKQTFQDDEQIKVLSVNGTKLGIDENMSESNWNIWFGHVERLVSESLKTIQEDSYTWYVGEKQYLDILDNIVKKGCAQYALSTKITLVEKDNKVSSSVIRENPLKYWEHIAVPFRGSFSTNILITGTASEGKSTLTRDIARYFGMPFCEEYARTYMQQLQKLDPDLTINDYVEFVVGQNRDIKTKMNSLDNHGILLSDTDNIVTLMYAQASAEDSSVDISWDDCKMLENLILTLQRDLTWHKIFLIPPKNDYVDDGFRNMAQASMSDRMNNYLKLTMLLKQFGWWDKVELLEGSYLSNYERVKEYVQSIL